MILKGKFVKFNLVSFCNEFFQCAKTAKNVPLINDLIKEIESMFINLFRPIDDSCF